MAEIKQITTITEVNIDVVNNIKIFTFYNGEGLPNTISAFFASEIASSNGVAYKEGDLVIVMKNYPSKIDFTVDENTGEILVIGEDADKYSYNEDTGQLVYTE